MTHRVDAQAAPRQLQIEDQGAADARSWLKLCVAGLVHGVSIGLRPILEKYKYLVAFRKVPASKEDLNVYCLTLSC
jgi:hypothetical protein